MRDYFGPILPGGNPDPSAVDFPVRVFEDRPRPDLAGSAGAALPRSGGLAEKPPLPVEFSGQMSWDMAEFALFLSAPPDEAQAAGITTVIAAWGATAIAGGFGGNAHSVGDPLMTTTDSGKPVVLWSADLGSAAGDVIDRRVEMLRNACWAYRVQSVKLVVGHGSDLEDPSSRVR